MDLSVSAEKLDGSNSGEWLPQVKTGCLSKVDQKRFHNFGIPLEHSGLVQGLVQTLDRIQHWRDYYFSLDEVKS